MTVAESLTDAGFGLGWSVVKALPEPAADRLFGAAAERTWRRQGQSVRQLKANLARVLGSDRIGELDGVAHEGVRRYLRYWCEVFRAPSWSAERVNRTFRIVDGMDRLDAAMAAGTGAIMVCPHMGNWDVAAAWASLRYGSLVTVAERLKPEGLFDRFVTYRESLGMEVLPYGDPDVMRILIRRLKEGALVCLLADRDLSHGGIPVTFFGEVATMPGGPAALALFTGAPLMPLSLWHVDGGIEAEIGAPIAIPDSGPRSERIATITQSMADAFEARIARHPEDWHMMQPLWTVDLGEGR